MFPVGFGSRVDREREIPYLNAEAKEIIKRGLVNPWYKESTEMEELFSLRVRLLRVQILFSFLMLLKENVSHSPSYIWRLAVKWL